MHVPPEAGPRTLFHADAQAGKRNVLAREAPGHTIDPPQPRRILLK